MTEQKSKTDTDTPAPAPPAVSATRDAMSRALGTAFLNHQVEQLEKSVNNWQKGRGGKRSGAPVSSSPPPKAKGSNAARSGVDESGMTRRRSDEIKTRDGYMDKKDASQKPKSGNKVADIIVVDASVLVHALYQVKQWCKEDREEIIIIPLEALNTLDLLKKGTSPLAQRARAASRILEEQVGTNGRIRVQRDDAFVLWDNIAFNHNAEDGDRENVSPEWVRCTVCCARWEVDNAKKTSVEASHVVLAVCPQTVAPPAINSASGAPMPVYHVARASGALVSTWAHKAGIEVLDVSPAIPGAGRAEEKHREIEDKKARRMSDGHGHGRGRGRGGFGVAGTGPGGAWGNKGGGFGAGGKAGKPGKGLVERPATVIAMMEPGRPNVRVLARGEKLDVPP